MPTVTLSSKSQVVLPSEVRKALGLRPGDKLIIEAHGDHAVVRKAPADDLEALQRYVSDVWVGYAEELERARDEWD
ncbi:MAG: AbrB/MazE/SpoVT family DNA-binding domain-containing protein [Serratia inhibens]|uniref:AbrB/MazE/SpoVT family DNA-binding domain-containing protein n=1 Tax=Serratia inhibens TaxID=2338073 RepID=UPI003C7A31A6